MADKEVVVKKETAEQKQNREDAARLAAASEATDAEGSTTDAVAAANVAASERAGEITTAIAKTKEPDGAQNPDKTRPADRTAAEQTPASKAKAAKKFDLRERFLELSDYKESDIVGSSEERRVVVTANGGKYEVSVKGKRIRKLAGPDTPAAIAAASEEEDDE